MNNFIKTHLEIFNEKNFSNPIIELRALLNKASILEKEMLEHAANLEFEEAAIVRDKIKKIKLSDLELITTKRITN